MSTPAHSTVGAQLAQLGHTNISDVLAKACVDYGDKPAFSCGADSLSFTGLDQRADALSRYLRGPAGLEPGDRLAIQLPNLLQYTIAIFAALKAGLVIVNTNPQYTPSEARHQFADSGAKAVVVLDKLVPLVRKIQGETEVELLIVTSVDDFANPQYTSDADDEVRFMHAVRDGAALPAVRHERELDDLALLQYTGGTTGVSKGAMLSHRNILSNVLQAVNIIRPGDVEYGNEVRVSPLPLYHIFAFTANCIASVATGFHSVLITNPRDLDSMIADLKRHQITLLTGINSLFVSLMAHPEFDSIGFSRLKWVNSGGAPLNTEIARRWQARTGSVVREGYGLTETSPVVVASTAFTPYKEGYIGRAVIDTEMRTVDDDGNVLPRDGQSAGHIHVRGPWIIDSYYRGAGPDSFTDDGWFKTGDVGHIDQDGYMTITDRSKDVIKSGGEWVSSIDLENAAMGHPDVAMAAAIGMPHPKWQERPLLIVQPKPNTNPTADSIRDYLATRVPKWWLPDGVEFIDEMPIGATGKILKTKLREMFKDYTFPE
ncbi:MAG TPA: long-chain fatty acid--CoA ligase [Oceanicaulis sp.]|nr:long-chain fatty acid--CoA ligase [Oceanicaulis sp.]